MNEETNRLNNSLKHIISDDDEVMAILDTIKELVSLEEKRIGALGIDKDKIYHIKDTNLGKILSLLLKNRNVESEISLDETNYANRCIETAKIRIGRKCREKARYETSKGIITVNISGLNQHL